ncbi:HEXXH motif domain-containing protein [Nocardia sp. NRRL S-836]|uniref:HEXXH motif domain-containing protein n=1 Tax=Nocardia sp. NRRL S-836 TaxID=1519492 RepID=UPI001E34B57F|nr:HEXXH motif domain-containing protein [Nocardia sp. NRRL S-836]
MVDQLAHGGGDAAALRLLRDGQLSARLVSLRALLDEVVDRPLRLRVDDAWDLLVAAQRTSPSLVREVLLLPQIGVWLADLLRRLRGSAESAQPLWVEVGHLSCVAAAAAHLCGIEFSIDVPVSEGVVSFPSLGVATVPDTSPWAVARAESRAGLLSVSRGGRTVRIPDDENWASVRRIGAGDFTPLLDDVEPHRDYRARVAPNRLTDGEISRWAAGLTEAWSLLGGDYAAAVSALISTIVPALPMSDGRPYSGSSADACGAVVMSLPPDAAAFAETLAHEVQHTKLAALAAMEPLCATGGSAHCYAPWRDDPRPVSGLLQGVYAFLGVADFWRAHRQTAVSDHADFEFAYWCGQTSRTARFLRECGELTALGRRFATTMATQLARWSRIQVSDVAAHAARLATRDHRATWRARHLAPEPAAVRLLAEAWLAGDPRPAGELPRVRLSPGPTPPQPRMELRRLWLRAPAALAAHSNTVPATTAADLLHVTGDQEGAARLYLADLEARPDDALAWVGLGLADPWAGVLLRRPEVVMAVHAEVTRRTGELSDPRELVAWIGS